MAEDLSKLDNWLNKTEDKLDGGKIQRPGNVFGDLAIYDICSFNFDILQAVLLTRAKH